jgi:hypothetical protein
MHKIHLPVIKRSFFLFGLQLIFKHFIQNIQTSAELTSILTHLPCAYSQQLNAKIRLERDRDRVVPIYFIFIFSESYGAWSKTPVSNKTIKRKDVSVNFMKAQGRLEIKLQP